MKLINDKEAGSAFQRGRPASLLLPFCLGLALCVASCGLEDYPYLYPASGVSQQSGTTLDFSHNTENNSASCFLGYEVYYRIYDGTASSGVSSVASSDGAYIESSWDSVTPDVILARLKAKGYVRLIRTDRSSSPFVVISGATQSSGQSVYVTFTLDATGTGNVMVNSATTETFTVRRNAYNSAGSAYRNFSDFTKGDDCNYTTTSATDPDLAYVRAYVFAYGLDSSSLDTVVSRPSLLTDGAIALTKGASD
jgi:hypothetical protein